MLKRRITSIVLYFAICFAIFLLIQKPVFLLYNWNHGTSAMSLADWGAVYYHGFAIDLASAGYLTALPLLLVWASLLLPRFRVVPWLKVYNLIVAICLALITTADAALYEFWEFKLDATVFMYIGDPKNAFASVSVGYVLVRLLVVIALAALFYWLLMLPFRRWNQAGSRPRWYWAVLAMLVLGGLTFGAIRGTRIWPNTPTRAFFSKTTYLNHAALNPMFNLIYTSTKLDKFDKEFKVFPEEECARDFEGLFPTSGVTVDTLIHNQRVHDALMRVDNNILKLDTVSNDYIKKVDRPTGTYDVEHIIDRMKAFDGHIIIQTIFLHGPGVSNTDEAFVAPWLEAVKAIKPQEVMVYTIDRETPDYTLTKATHNELDSIRDRVIAAGIPCLASY